MRIEEFPECCGANVLVEFSGNKNAWGVNSYDADHPEYNKFPSESEVEKYLEYQIKNMEGAFLFAILTAHQKKALGKVFLKCRFKMVGMGKNPGHRSTLYTYMYSRKRLPPKPKAGRDYWADQVDEF